MKLERHCMIIGAEVISSDESDPDSSIIRLKLMELKLVKNIQRTKIRDLVMGGSSPEELAKSMMQVQQRFDIMYITTGYWRENNLKIGRHMTLELDIDDTTGGVK